MTNRTISRAAMLVALSVAATSLLVAGPASADVPATVPAAEVWAISDGYKLLATGDAFAESAELKIAEIRQANEVWDSAASMVRLHAARGDVVAFQIIVERSGPEKLQQVDVQVSSLRGPETVLDYRHIAVFREFYMQLDGKWYPDMLIPAAEYHGLPCDLPDPFNEIPDQRVQGIWIDITVPRDAGPGRYSGLATVLAGGKTVREIKIDLEVWPFEIPLKWHIYGELNTYLEKWMRPWKVRDGSAGDLELMARFMQEARKHRCEFDITMHSQRGRIAGHGTGFAPDLVGRGKDIKVIWDKYDRRWGRFFDGSAFEDGVPLHFQYLPFNAYWPSGLDVYKTDPQRYHDEWIAVCRQFARHFREKGWTRTRFDVAPNHKKNHNPDIPWDTNEPTKKHHYEGVRMFCDMTHEGFADAGDVQFAYRLVIGHFMCKDVKRRCRNKDWWRANAAQILEPCDVWQISVSHYDVKACIEMQKRGKWVEMRGGMPRIDEGLLPGRRWGWQCFLWRSNGFRFWHSTNWNDADPYRKPDNDRWRGFSMAFYPGAPINYFGPLPSMRLKAVRRGALDYEYMYQLARLSGGNWAAVDALIAPRMTDNPADWHAGRLAVAEAILAGGLKGTPAAATQAAGQVSGWGGGGFCVKCDEMLPAGAKVCVFCGAKQP